ncbi:MAG: phosphatase PAP2 family protein [Polyangiales bacterium]
MAHTPVDSQKTHGAAVVAAYFAVVSLMVGRIAWVDTWSLTSFCVLVAFVATAGTDRVAQPSRRSLALGATFFFVLSMAVAYLPDMWFAIAYRLNHAEHYLWNANALMKALPGNDGRFLWSHRSEPISRLMRWVYITGFDMVVWIPVVRSLVAFDARKTARYALAAHLVQFPLIIPFYTAIRVDEVWSVLGHQDLLGRGWNDEVRLDLGANCFPSMHTSVAFAILLLGLREKSALFRRGLAIYASAIIFSTVYMEVHWLVDVVAGLALGAVSVNLVDRLLLAVDRRERRLENPRIEVVEPAPHSSALRDIPPP